MIGVKYNMLFDDPTVGLRGELEVTGRAKFSLLNVRVAVVANVSRSGGL
jgi:hypothetical protein